jgi:hypothetical protein
MQHQHEATISLFDGRIFYIGFSGPVQLRDYSAVPTPCPCLHHPRVLIILSALETYFHCGNRAILTVRLENGTWMSRDGFCQS